MTTQSQPTVAVLLSTHNGRQHIGAQISSLQKNSVPFALHWIDDHSTDNTRELVREITHAGRIPLVEWHQPTRQGVPGAFFTLMECASADIYLFCDQDDIWQPGKLDATVADLIPDIRSPALVSQDALAFMDGRPEELRYISDIVRVGQRQSANPSSVFTFNLAQGNTIGLTRPLRDLFLLHRDIARSYAAMHDWWLHLIALASGVSRKLVNAPTTLYRLHAKNTAGLNFDHFTWHGALDGRAMWDLQRSVRRWSARQAQGFCLAAQTLPPGPKLDRMLDLASMVSTLEHRQSPRDIFRLAAQGAFPPLKTWATWLGIACLCCDA